MPEAELTLFVDPRRVRSVRVADLAQVIDDLRSLHSDTPVLACVANAAGDELWFGVGGDWSTLNWIAAGGDPPYWSSRAAPELTRQVPALIWLDDGLAVDFPRDRTVRWEAARKAILDFALNGGRSTAVDWQEV